MNQDTSHSKVAPCWSLDEKSRRKYELAEEFGLTETLLEKGWAGLSAKDSGRIGGRMRGKTKRK